MLLILLSIGFFSSGAQTQKQLPFGNYISKRGGLNNTRTAITLNKKATVAFLGGSITFNPGWRDMVCAYLKQQYPDTKFHFIAAGIPSLGSLPHVFRLQQDVLDSGKVDLMFLESAVNDQVNHTDSIIQVRSLEGIIRHARRSNRQMDIILMSFADPDKTTMYLKGITPVPVANHELVAGHYNLPSINLARAVSDKLANHEFSWDNDFKDLHPAPFGQNLYFSAIRELLISCLNADQTGTETSRKANRLPQLLDKFSFEKGRYLSIENAKVNNDWAVNRIWTPDDGLSTRPGFVQVPMLIGTRPVATFVLKFKGSAIGMAIVSGSDAGIVKYQIDNGPEKQMDLFTEWSQSLHLPWYVLFSGSLKNTNHILKVTLSTERNVKSKGTACRIVNFLVNN